MNFLSYLQSHGSVDAIADAVAKKELWRLSATEVADGVRDQVFTCQAVLESCKARVESTNGTINAITEFFWDDALVAAVAADKAVKRGDNIGALHGVPVTIKGNVDLAGSATVNGSPAFVNRIAKETSPSVQNLINAGAIAIGRTNTPEFCIRWETNNDVYGQTVNPWDAARTPGGSSGGAAASLAVGMTPLAHGTDIGGSLRQPAQCCAVASIRPTLGRVPHYIPSEPDPGMGPQLMGVEGPMARSIADVRLGLKVMSVGDWRDPSWAPAPLTKPAPNDLPIAVIDDPIGLGVDDQVADGIRKAVRFAKKAGYKTERAEPSTLSEAVDVWTNILVWEIQNGFEPAVKDIAGPSGRKTFQRIRESFPNLTVQKYIEAFADRRRVLRDWMGFFQRYSVIIAPVGANRPHLRDSDLATTEAHDKMVLSMRMLRAISALGLPSVVVPVGVGEKLPQAVQIIGAPYQEMLCLEVAEAIEGYVSSETRAMLDWGVGQ